MLSKINSMRKLTLYFGMLALLVCGTGCKQKTHEYFLAKDTVTTYKAPSDTAEVIRVLKTFASVPFTIVERDSTGQWGRMRLNYLIFKKNAWIPLEKMVYCGSDNPEEELETCIVKPEKLQLYSFPKEDKDHVCQPLQQNDTVQITTRDGKWVYVRCLKYSYGKLSAPTAWWGWTLENQLQPIGVMTNAELTAIETAKTNKMVAARVSERFSPLMAKVHPIYAKACVWVGMLLVVIVAALLIPAWRRYKTFDLLTMLLMVPLLYFGGTRLGAPSWYFALLIPLMTYVICYPLLYFDDASFLFAGIYYGLTAVVAGFYLYLYTNIPKNDSIVIYRIIQALLLLGVCLAIAYVIREKREKDHCPHCGHYAGHKDLKKDVLNTQVTHGTGSSTRHVGTSRKYEMGREVVTEHYETTHYKTETTTTRTLVTRKCIKCGSTYHYQETWTTTRKVK